MAALVDICLKYCTKSIAIDAHIYDHICIHTYIYIYNYIYIYVMIYTYVYIYIYIYIKIVNAKSVRSCVLAFTDMFLRICSCCIVFSSYNFEGAFSPTFSMFLLSRGIYR